MNKVIFTVSILIAAFLGYFLGKNDGFTTAQRAFSEISEQNAVPGAETIKTSPANLSENNFHSGSTPSLHRQSSRPAVTAGNMAQQQLDTVKTEYEFRLRAEGFTQWLTKNQETKPWFDLGIEMRGRFDIEESDYQWALTQESHLQNLFSQAPALAGVALKSAICKSTQCQITISVMDHDHANETAMAISKVLGSEDNRQIIIDNQIQKGEAIFYVARNEKGFEFN